MERGIFRVPARRKRKVEVKPSDIPTLKDYTARLVDKKWLRLSSEAACLNVLSAGAKSAGENSPQHSKTIVGAVLSMALNLPCRNWRRSAKSRLRRKRRKNAQPGASAKQR
jgi:hypothetical protein